MCMKAALTRRGFLRAAAAAGAAPCVIGRIGSAADASGRPAASDRVAVGMIGVGSMGGGHLACLVGMPEAKVVAVCDVSAAVREQAKGRAGNGCAAYADFRELLDRQDIDAVVVATPDHWHALATIEAARQGKDVYCEKPLTRTLAESQAVLRAVRRYGRVFQHGTQQRSDGGFRFACELVRNGRIGKVHTVEVSVPGGWTMPMPAPEPPPDPKVFDYDLWLGPAPWAPFSRARVDRVRWHHTYDYTIGYMAGWGAHHIDIAQWGQGMDDGGPVEYEGRAAFDREGICDAALAWRVECTYASGVRMIFTDSGYAFYGRAMDLPEGGSYRLRQGVRFVGSEGWVFVDRGAIDANPKSLLKEPIRPNEVRLYHSDNHMADFLRCVRTRMDPAAPVEAAHRSNSVCLIAELAARLGRKLKWDPQAERFLADEEANRLLSRAMREPWHL